MKKITKESIFITTLLIMINLFANISNNLYALSEDNNYSENIINQAVPYFKGHSKFGTFKGVENIAINYTIVRPDESAKHPSDDAIVIVGGRAEFFGKYIEMIYDLKDLGMTIYTIDHRGQGLSERMLDDPEKGYVKNFDDYLEDFNRFLRKIVRPNNHRKVFFITHSLGGNILLNYLIKFQEKIQVNVAGIALSSPMIAIKTNYYVVQAYAKFKTATDYIDDSNTTYEITYADNNNDITSSDIRYQMIKNMFDLFPKAKLGGSTANWLKETSSAGRFIQKNAELLPNVPLILLQAEKDQKLDPEAQQEMCSNAPNCKLILMKNSEHDVYMEKDIIRDQAINLIKDLINSN